MKAHKWPQEMSLESAEGYEFEKIEPKGRN